MSSAALPPYAFVPGSWPHPRRDPRGHSFGLPEPEAPPLDPAAWRRSKLYLRAVELFNHGYYWEAHEAFEALWNAAGREGLVAELLRGLIKLCALGVKVRQGNRRGVRSHAEGATRRLESVRRSLATPAFAGLELEPLTAAARAIAQDPGGLSGNPHARVEVALPIRLEPR